MSIAANIVVGFVALLHLYIVVLEMFMWNRARKVFGFGREDKDNESMQKMLKNQGLYNGFLVAGLVWGLVHTDPSMAWQLKLFFLGCVAVAGIYGALTAQIKILFIQTVPAAIGIAFLFLAK